MEKTAYPNQAAQLKPIQNNNQTGQTIGQDRAKEMDMTSITMQHLGHIKSQKC